MKVVSSIQMRKIEQTAIEELGIPSILLMENASIRLAEHCFRLIDEVKNPRVLIAAGAGNNGGDGMALARHLHVKGIETKVIYVGDENSAKGNAAVNLAIIRKFGIPINHCTKEMIQGTDRLHEIEFDIKTCDLAVDAMLGTGLDRDVEGSYKYMIETINRYAKCVISVDIPSGVHSDSGQIMGCAVKAAETITFCCPKTGLYAYPGAEFTGKIHVEDISIPHSLIDKIDTEAEILTDREAADMLPVRFMQRSSPRKLRSNKGDFGKVTVFAGSNEMPGAAALACSAAYKVGAGLVRACVLPHVADVINKWQREVVTHNVPEKNGMYIKKCVELSRDGIDNADVIVVGPGIGRSPDVTEFVRELITTVKAPLVLDADALFAVSEDKSILKKLKVPCVITPHPGEMSRLTGLSVSEVMSDTIGVAVKFAKEFNLVTLLKDAHTIIANPDGKYFINTTGNSALSKAGTGDVLTGMIAGFIAQNSCLKDSCYPLDSCCSKDSSDVFAVSCGEVFRASALGAFFHGKAGEVAALKTSCYGIMAEDVIEEAAVLTAAARVIGRDVD